MTILTQVLRNGQVTLPVSLRRKYNIEEGDVMEIREQDNQLVLCPKKLIDADQSWFWSKEWQKKESKAEDDIAKGAVVEITSMKKLSKALKQ